MMMMVILYLSILVVVAISVYFGLVKYESRHLNKDFNDFNDAKSKYEMLIKVIERIKREMAEADISNERKDMLRKMLLKSLADAKHQAEVITHLEKGTGE